MRRESIEKRKRRPRIPQEELFDRDGRWVRVFSVRSDAWPIVEHWASENDYYMAAMRGGRRLYQRGDNTSFYITLLDIKQDSGRVKISAWIHVGFIARLLSLFLLPAEMPIEPHGLLGSIARRRACAEFNSLLVRLKQIPILGSTGLHIADLDPSTLILGILLPLPILAYLYYTALRLQIRPGLANPLLLSMGDWFGNLLAGGVLIVGAYQMFLVRRLQTPLYKWISVGFSFLLFSVISIVAMTRTSTDMLETRVVYHCVHHFDSAECLVALDGLNIRDRGEVLGHLRHLEQELTLRDAAHPAKSSLVQ